MGGQSINISSITKTLEHFKIRIENCLVSRVSLKQVCLRFFYQLNVVFFSNQKLYYLRVRLVGTMPIKCTRSRFRRFLIAFSPTKQRCILLESY